MIKTRGRKILRDIWARKGRTFLVSMAIFIGVTGTIALFSMSDIIVSQLREDIKEEELSMLDVFVTVNAGEEVNDATYLQSLRDIPGVTEVQGGIQATSYFKLKPEDEDFEEGILYTYSEPYEPRLPITPMRLIEGNYPGGNEVAIEKRMAEKYSLGVGDTVYFRVLSPSRDESKQGEIGTIEPRTVSGIVFHPYAFGDENIYGQLDDVKYIVGTTGFTQFSARFIDYETAQEQKEAFSNLIANDTPYIPVFIQSEDPAENSQIQGAQTIASTMGFLALVALIVSGFLVINVISSLVLEQKRQIGVMKSMGASRLDNFLIYSGIAFMYGLIGVFFGVLVGIPLGDWASHALAPQLNTSIEGFKISLPSVIMGVVIGLLVPVLAALLPVFFGTRVRILEAMTDLGIDARYGYGPLARIIGRLPVPVTVRQGLSNVSIKKTRLIFTVITLAIAAGAFMGIFSVFDSLTNGINLFLDSFNVEIFAAPIEGRDPDQVIGILHDNFQTDQNDVLKAIEPGFQLQVEFEGYAPPPAAGGPPGIFAYGYAVESPTPAFNVEVDEGDDLTLDNAGDGIILSSLLANNMKKQVGDSVVLKVPGNHAELKVVGISDYPLEQVWLDWRTLAKIAGYTVGAPKPNEYMTTVTVDGFEGSQDGNVAIVGFDEQIGQFLTFSEGDFVTPGAPGIIISQAMADQGGYSVGDTLTLTATTENGSSGEYPIVGIFEIPPMIQTMAEAQGQEIPPDVMGMYWEDLAQFEGLSREGKPLPQGYMLTTTLSEATVDQIDDVITEMNDTMLNSGIPTQFFNFVELKNQISQTFTLIQVILQAVALLIALVGALGLLTTLSMSVFERQKEIGVMRSIGASSSTVAGQFLTEGLVVGVISWILGLPLAVLIEALLLEVTGFNETFPLVFPVSAALIGLAGMLGITTIASLWPSLAAARKTVSDILRYQ
jgi:putative ABC transport system permease protein